VAVQSQSRGWGWDVDDEPGMSSVAVQSQSRGRGWEVNDVPGMPLLHLLSMTAHCLCHICIFWPSDLEFISWSIQSLLQGDWHLLFRRLLHSRTRSNRFLHIQFCFSIHSWIPLRSRCYMCSDIPVQSLMLGLTTLFKTKWVICETYWNRLHKTFLNTLSISLISWVFLIISIIYIIPIYFPAVFTDQYRR
jgi:hypothetical protein